MHLLHSDPTETVLISGAPDLNPQMVPELATIDPTQIDWQRPASTIEEIGIRLELAERRIAMLEEQNQWLREQLSSLLNLSPPGMSLEMWKWANREPER